MEILHFEDLGDTSVQGYLHDTHAQHYQGILEKLCAVKTPYLMIS